LRDVSFEVAPGTVVGILGDNGGGKTTLLRILARISHPTEGRAEIRGRTGALLDGLAGFHGELTGRDNVFLLGTLLGLTRSESKARFDSIVHFAELEDFLEVPLKFYSSGMCVRLAFAIAAHADTDVLLIDEILAVADRSFQSKSLRKISALANSGRTILFVSHDLALVRQVCTQGMVLSGGRLVYFGSTHEAIQRYKTVQCRAPFPDA
jgi:lipopolysaccharide transport system ATP-binding protein